MSRSIGIVTAEVISSALVVNNQVQGPVLVFPTGEDSVMEDLIGYPADALIHKICEIIETTPGIESVDCIGLGFPGLIRDNVVDESPNYRQMKGIRLGDVVKAELALKGIHVPVTVSNDADVVAAGIAASRGHLDRLIRVWTLGNGIGFGHYPSNSGVWEGGHTIVTLDPKEKYCGCGGTGHLEGIMGYRAMRLRFLDLEPEEIFSNANEGDQRCAEFVKLWHRALAAATASSIHMDGPGKFYITGPSANFLNLSMLNQYMHEMVKISPLQGYVFEIVPGGQEIAILGAATVARQALETATGA
jgi:predicted NBD/HSP70 family sugar kinase